MKEKKAKGQYGYRTYHRKAALYQVLFGAVMILLQLFARNFTTNQSFKNILTVMAILSVLPTANVASPLLAAWKYKTPDLEFYHLTKNYETKFTVLYDLIITSKEAILPMDALIVHPTGIYCCCTCAKANIKKGEKAMNDMFVVHKLDPNVKVMTDRDLFLRRLESLKPAAEYEDDGSVKCATELLKNLSM